MADSVKISRSRLELFMAATSVAAIVAAFIFFRSPYTSVLVFTALLLVWGAYYATVSKEKLSEMCCMMSGMAYGMTAGFFIGALAGLATGDFMAAMIVGTAAGILFGIPVGRIGGPLGRMEGVMAGPMGGIMGGMTGVMVQFFNVTLFMPFLVLVVVFTIWEMTRVVHSHSKNIGKGFMYLGLVLSLLALGSAVFTNIEPKTGVAFAKESSQKSIKNIQAAPSPSPSGVQEAKIKMELFGYNPNYLTLRKGVPARIKLEAAENAGCTRAIVFPDFGIRKTLPRGGTDVIEFTPTKAGTFRFSCSMAMASGTLVVQ